MVKLDVTGIKFLEDEDFRVLTALEMALRNHDVAPTVLIERIAGLPHGGARRRLNGMLKQKLIHHESKVYDGFAMKYNAYDFLALRTFCKRGTVLGVGCRVGCGKESDIFVVQDENGNDAILKLQRLGRCSFRSVARNRDYKGGGKKRHGASWFYLSRLAAQKEYAFMKMLHDEGFPVPKPIDHNRHAIVMEHVNATLLNHIEHLDNPQKVYERCLALIVRLAQAGLVHGDFNEFNLFVNNDMQIIMIDFPQMVSIDHLNASELFDRDVNNLALFFERRFGLTQSYFPKLETDVERSGQLDRTVIASGAISKQQLKDLEMLQAENDEEEEEEEEEENEDEEEEVEEDKKAKPAAAKKNNNNIKKSSQNDDDEDEDEVEEKSASTKQLASTSIATPATTTVTTTRAPQRFTSLAQLAKGADFENLIGQLGAVTTNTINNNNSSPTVLVASKAIISKKDMKLQQKEARKKIEGETNEQKDPEEVEEEEEAEEEEHDNVSQEEGEGGEGDNKNKIPVGAQSIATTVAPQMLSREVIRERVKRQLQHAEDFEFKRTMHRNTQKGRDKVRIKRQIKSHSVQDASDFW